MSDTNPTKTNILTNDPEFLALAKLRSRVVLWLAGGLLVLYFINIALLSFAAPLAARPLFEGGIVTIGIAYATFLVIAGAIVASIYTVFANRHIDKRRRRIIDRIGKNEAGDANL